MWAIRASPCWRTSSLAGASGAGRLRCRVDIRPRTTTRQPPGSDGWLDGVSALMWIARAKGVGLNLDLSRAQPHAVGQKPKLRVLSLGPARRPEPCPRTERRRPRPLAEQPDQHRHKLYDDLRHVCKALTSGRLSGLGSLNLAGTDLRDEGGVMVVEVLMGLPLEMLDLYSGQHARGQDRSCPGQPACTDHDAHPLKLWLQ